MKKIKFIYDKLGSDYPLMNGFPDTMSSLYIDLFYSFPEKFFESIDDIKTTDTDLYLYPIELLKFHFSEVFQKLNKKSIDKIREFNIPILIYFPTEGFKNNGQGGEYWLDRLHQQFDQYGFHNNPKFLIFGNLLIEESYNRYVMADVNSLKVVLESGREVVLSHYQDLVNLNTLKKQIYSNVFTKVYGLNYFENNFCRILSSRWRNQYFRNREEISFEETKSSQKSKNFLSYNGNFRPGRLALVSELVRKNLYQNSYLSFIGGRLIKIEKCIDESKKMLPYEGRIFLENYVDDWKPMQIDIDGDEKQNDILSSNKSHYLNSYFSIVSETEVDNDVLFLTEKIFKPIAFYHPFLVWGQPKILKKLRSFGYQTFPEMFDESYDDITNNQQRLAMIIDQVERFINLDIEEKDKKFFSVLEKLEYNRNLFYERKDKFTEDINCILEDIQKQLDQL